MLDSVCKRHAEEFIRSFVVASKRDRLLGLLGSEKGRLKIQRDLYHFNKLLDPATSVPIPGSVFSMSKPRVIDFLFEEGAPAACVFLGGGGPCGMLDVRSTLLQIPCVFVGVISAVPGRLAFYLGEYQEDARVLRALPGPPKTPGDRPA